MINSQFTSMKLSQFRYACPKELIAEKPNRQRDEARMLVVHRDTGAIEHRKVKDLIDYVDEHDVVVLNNTKVFPAALTGIKEKTEAAISVILLRELNAESRLWDVVVDPARKIRIGNKLYFGANEDLIAEVIDNTTSRGRTIRFLFDGTEREFITKIKSMGHVPLPDDILSRRNYNKNIDEEYYQTIYAKEEGAVCAPTSGLHISRELLKRFEIKNVNVAELTVHTGLGNYRTIEVEDLSKHRQDSEPMYIGQECCDMVNNAKAEGHRILSVGCSTMRALETAVTIPGVIRPFKGWSNKFIFPPYHFSIADMLFCNLNASASIMLILAATFGGLDYVMYAYQTAVHDRYRFGTYGDAMLIV